MGYAPQIFDDNPGPPDFMIGVKLIGLIIGAICSLLFSVGMTMMILAKIAETIGVNL